MGDNPLQKHCLILCQELDVEMILPYLQAERMVTSDEYETLTSNAFTTRRKREKLLLLLPRKGREYFKNFGKCLVWSGQTDLARHIGIDVLSVPESPHPAPPPTGSQTPSQLQNIIQGHHAPIYPSGSQLTPQRPQDVTSATAYSYISEAVDSLECTLTTMSCDNIVQGRPTQPQPHPNAAMATCSTQPHPNTAVVIKPYNPLKDPCPTPRQPPSVHSTSTGSGTQTPCQPGLTQPQPNAAMATGLTQPHPNAAMVTKPYNPQKDPYPTPHQPSSVYITGSVAQTPRQLGPPKVFILYCKDTDLQDRSAEEFCDDVLALSDILRYCGIECMIDGYTEHQANWDVWTQEMIRWSDYVLMVCSPTLSQSLQSQAMTAIEMAKGKFFNHSVTSYVQAPKFIPTFLNNCKPRNLLDWIPPVLRMTLILCLNITELSNCIEVKEGPDHNRLLQENLRAALEDPRFRNIGILLRHLRRHPDITAPPILNLVTADSGLMPLPIKQLHTPSAHHVLAPSQEAEYISMKDLRYIAERLPQDWQHLGIKLGVEYSKLEELRTKHPFDKTSATLEIFSVWQNKKGKQATKKALKKALIDLHYGLLAKELFESTESETGNAASKVTSAHSEFSSSTLLTCPIIGVHLTKSKSITITATKEPQPFIWREHGLKILIVPETLPETVSDCTFTLGVTCNHTNLRFLPNVVPVSPVYFIKPSTKLCKPVTLKIEHCCELKSSEQSQGLVAMLAHTTSQTPPYEFEYLEGGKFPHGSSWGQVQVSSFTLYTFVYDFLRGFFSVPIVYNARVCYCQIGGMIYKAAIAVSRNLAHCKNVIEENCFKDTWKTITQFEFQFNGEYNDTLTFMLPKDDERVNNGWKITACTPPCQVAKSVLDNTEYSWTEITLSWENTDGVIGKLRHSIRMIGIDKECFEIVIDPCWQNTFSQLEEHLLDSVARIHVRPQLSEAFKVLLPVASKWEDIAVMLSIPHDRLTAIRQENQLRVNSCLRVVLTEWLNQTNPPPSWNALAEVMELLSNPAKAHEIRENYI